MLCLLYVHGEKFSSEKEGEIHLDEHHLHSLPKKNRRDHINSRTDTLKIKTIMNNTIHSSYTS